jgi:hypothetical protein
MSRVKRSHEKRQRTAHLRAKLKELFLQRQRLVEPLLALRQVPELVMARGLRCGVVAGLRGREACAQVAAPAVAVTIGHGELGELAADLRHGNERCSVLRKLVVRLRPLTRHSLLRNCRAV